MRRLTHFVPLLLASLAPLRAQEPFRLVPLAAAEPAPAAPAWLDFAAAEAASKQRHVDLLLYFTAAW